MLIRFLPHGRGSGQAAVTYLLRPRDHRGTPREEIRVLLGNPEADAKLIDNLKFKNRYSSGVLAWAPEDNPTNEQIMAVLDDFEKVAFAGLQSNQYTWSAVLHREKKGGVHVHFIVPCVELQSGKSFNVAPPRWDHDLNPVAEMHNYRHGWARPDDPARRRLVRPGPSFEAKLQATAKRAGVEELSSREEITAWLIGRVENGLVENRAGVRDSLAELGTITRETDISISVKLPGAKRAIRLKGLLYEREFSPGLIAKITAEKARGPAPVADNVRRAERKFEQACARRSKRNLAKYPAGIEQGQEAIPEAAAEELVHSPDGRRPDAGVPGGNRGRDPAVDHDRDRIIGPAPRRSSPNCQEPGQQTFDEDGRELVPRPGLDPPGGGWQLVDKDRLKGDDDGSTYRDRAGIAGPDRENSEGMGRAGSAFDEACRRRYQRRKRKRRAFDKNYADFENSIGQFGNAARIRARIARAIKELGKAIKKWLNSFRKEKEKRPDDEWNNPFLLNLRPPW